MRQHPELSFWTVTETPSGRCVANDPFDAPLEAYGPGCETGNRFAEEFMTALAEDRPFCASSVIQQACRVMDREHPASTAELSRKGAAVGFLTSLVPFLRFAAKSGDFPKHFAEKRARLEAFEASMTPAKTAATVARESAKASSSNSSGSTGGTARAGRRSSCLKPSDQSLSVLPGAAA